MRSQKSRLAKALPLCFRKDLLGRILGYVLCSLPSDTVCQLYRWLLNIKVLVSLFIETTFTDQQEVFASHLSVLILEPSYMCEKQHLLTKVSVFISLVLSVLFESFVC